MISRLFALPLLASASLALAAPAVAQGDSAAAGVLELRALDARVATIGHRLAVANLERCRHRQWLPGIALHDLSQYGGASRQGAIRAFGLNSGPGVLALAAGGPAERAGLRPDDILLSVDGEALPRPRDDDFAEMERLLDAFEAAFADGMAVLGIRRDGRAMAVQVPAEQGCRTRFQVIPSRRLNARADGLYVQLNSAIVTYVRDDSELAAVIAHEFAHNVLRHKERLDELGARRGTAGNFGRSAVLIRETEAEADRMSVHLLHRAGYDPEGAVRFWSRFGRRGLIFFNDPQHPSWRRRITMFQQEIAAIRAAEAAGIAPVPTFLAAAAATQD